MAKFLFLYRVPRDYRPDSKTIGSWESWFEAIRSHKIDPGHGVVECRALGDLGPRTRAGGYTVVDAENIEAAVALAKGAPSIAFGGGVEVGAIPDAKRQ